ncbi:MAG: putative rane protein glycine-rich [Jatrophihabitantaceae bacterium]|nr:putative rane protein glycine-rich [Jatrophihabitantaceae bacterium]
MSNPAQAARDFGGRLYRTFAVRGSEFDRPLPSVQIELGRTAPAWALNAVVALLGLGCAALLADLPVHWVLAIAGAAAMAIRPLPGMAQTYAGVLGAGLVLTRYEPWAARVFLLILGVHLMVQLGSIVQGLHWSTRVEVAVLVAPARRFAIVQAGAQCVAIGSAWAAGRDIDAVWLSVVAALGLAGLAWFLLTAVGAQRTDEPEVPSTSGA